MVCLTQMQNKTEDACVDKVYYVRGSGWIPVPSSRLGEVPRVIAEHHEREARRDMLLLARP